MHATADQKLHQTVNRLILEAMEGQMDRRSEQRTPFFAPVQFALATEPCWEISAFSRDISPSGMGLLLSQPVEPGEAMLKFQSTSCGRVRIASRIVWCRPCGEGWYLAGAQFIEMAGDA